MTTAYSALSTAPAAGWYPDPLGTPLLRWWNVDGWTEHTAATDGAAPVAVFDLSALPAPDPSADLVIPEPVVAWEDWSVIGRRIHDLVASPRPRIAHLYLDDLDPIVIDTRYRAFGWTSRIRDLPRWVRRADIVVQLRAPLAPTVFTLRSGSLDELLAAVDARSEGRLGAD